MDCAARSGAAPVSLTTGDVWAAACAGGSPLCVHAAGLIVLSSTLNLCCLACPLHIPSILPSPGSVYVAVVFAGPGSSGPLPQRAPGPAVPRPLLGHRRLSSALLSSPFFSPDVSSAVTIRPRLFRLFSSGPPSGSAPQVAWGGRFGRHLPRVDHRAAHWHAGEAAGGGGRGGGRGGGARAPLPLNAHAHSFKAFYCRPLFFLAPLGRGLGSWPVGAGPADPV